MNKFTVFGFYESTGQCWTEHAEAKTPEAAVKIVAERLGAEDPSDVAIVDIIAGEHQSLGYCASVCYAVDINTRKQKTS